MLILLYGYPPLQSEYFSFLKSNHFDNKNNIQAVKIAGNILINSVLM